jgi:hypothetical protein
MMEMDGTRLSRFISTHWSSELRNKATKLAGSRSSMVRLASIADGGGEILKYNIFARGFREKRGEEATQGQERLMGRRNRASVHWAGRM